MEQAHDCRYLDRDLKEWRELLFQRGSWRAIMLSLLPSVMLFGIILPSQLGRFWLESLLPLGLWGWLPLLPVTAVIADAFAGRAAHLGDLLASPIRTSNFIW